MRLAATLACALLGVGAIGFGARAEEPERWRGPFGGFFNANVTIASDYAQNGISNTQLQPAFQAAIDYRTPDLTDAVPVWIYTTLFGSTVNFPMYGPGAELDAIGGVKLKALNRKLSFDLGYIRYTYPDVPASASFNYGEFNFAVGYDFGWASLTGRLRFSPDSLGNSGNSWNKRMLLSAPLPFISGDTFSFRAYGSLGNFWVDRYQQYGLPTQDYWYWQIGLVTSAWGLDMTLAYTDTSIEPEGCSNTRYCAGRTFVSITKTF